VVSFMPQPLYPRERAPGTYRRLGGPLSQSGHNEEKNSQYLPEMGIIQPVA